MSVVANRNNYLDTIKDNFIKSLLNYSDIIIPYEGLRDNCKLGPEDTVFYAVRDKYVFISCNFPSEDHQIAHMVEINSQRIFKDNWGMSEFHIEKLPVTGMCAAISRECRVRAIQSHMTKSRWDYTKSIINDLVHNDVVNRLPFLKFKNEKQLQDWYVHLYESTRSKWSLDRIESEWKNKINLIQEKYSPIN